MARTPLPNAISRVGQALALALGLVTLPGCLERTIVVTSEPPGAIVWLNDQEIGRTPVETDFTFYGNYDVRLHKEGYEPLVTNRVAESPIHETPGLDLIAEAIPAEIVNKVEWHFVLIPLPQQQEGADQTALRTGLIDRATDLRKQTTEKKE